MNLLSNVVNPEMKDITIKVIGENQKELFNVNVNESVAIHDGDMLHFTIKKTNESKMSINNIEINGKINQKEIKSNIGELHEYYYTPKSSSSSSSNSTSSNKPSSFSKSSNATFSSSNSTLTNDNYNVFPQQQQPKKAEQTISKNIPKVEKSLQGIISSQSFDGKWSASYLDQFIEILKENYDKDKFETKMKDLFQLINLLTIIFQINDEAIKRDIQSTIVAMCILNILYPEDKIKWGLVENKALDWLNSQTQKLWQNEITNIISSFFKPN